MKWHVRDIIEGYGEPSGNGKAWMAQKERVNQGVLPDNEIWDILGNGYIIHKYMLFIVGVLETMYRIRLEEGSKIEISVWR